MVASLRIANVIKNTPFMGSKQRANIESGLLHPVSLGDGNRSGIDGNELCSFYTSWEITF